MTTTNTDDLDIILRLEVKFFSYDTDAPLLSDVSLRAGQSEIVGLMGPNGSGKSTLMYLAAAEICSPSVSRFLACDEGQISFVYQDYRHTLFPWKTAEANICLPGKLRGNQGSPTMVDALVKDFAVNFDLHKYPFELSGGEQQKVCVIRALIESPKLLLMDEPCSAMDYASRLLFLRNLRTHLTETKTACILVSHSAEDAFVFCDRLLLLSISGSIVGTIENCQDRKSYNENIERVHAHFLGDKIVN